MLLPSRRPGRLPIVLAPERDELLSSWLQRIAAAYGTKPDAFLEQLGTIETDPTIFDWAARPEDIVQVAAALGTDRSDLVQRSFAGIPKAGLMFVSPRLPAKTCLPCKAEFDRRGLKTVVLHRWKVAVARRCGRCGSDLVSSRTPRSRHLQNIEIPGDLIEISEDIFNVVGMAMYDHTEAPVAARVFRAVSKRIFWPTPLINKSKKRSIKNGPAIMWRAWNKDRVGSDRAVPQSLSQRNFAGWPEKAQIIAAASVRQLAHGPAVEWSDLKRLGLVEVGDTTLARRLFRI